MRKDLSSLAGLIGAAAILAGCTVKTDPGPASASREEARADTQEPKDEPDAAAAGKRPLKVFILVGQSNMQGHAQARTLEHIGMDPETAPMLEDLLDAEGNPVVLDDAWISELGSGPNAEEARTGKLTVGFGAARRGRSSGPSSASAYTSARS